MAGDMRVVVHDGEVRKLLDDPGMRGLMLETAQPVVSAASGGAPKRTGAGAFSIHAEAVLDGREWDALVSWTQARFYLRFHEMGTKSLPARPFLVPALEGLAR
jgi:HK97 gp10 family phage protein